MFTNLLFLIIVLLLINLAPEISPAVWDSPPAAAFLMGMLCYFFTLCLIYLQNYILIKFKRRRANFHLLLVNIELLSFLCVYYFVLGSYRIFEEIPLLGSTSTLISLFSLGLYLAGLAVYHYSAYYVQASRLSGISMPSRRSTVVIEMRMLIPFAIPFILFSFLIDLLKLYPNENLQNFLIGNQASPLSALAVFICSLVFILAMLVFLPLIIQRIWQCKFLEQGPMLERLQKLCERANFKHAGIKTWTVLNQSLTAAIIGIAPKFRYVIFTKRLLREMEPAWIEAILAHEIGHSYRKHLLIYPFIIFGMILCTGLFSLIFSEAIYDFFNIQNTANPSETWLMLYPFAIFIPYSLIIAIYFRYVFGFFSRQFERQADLHVFHLGIDPRHLINALNYVGEATGNTHRNPSWHHYSIQERMDFLQAASQNPGLIAKHHRKVLYCLLSYALFVMAIFWLLLAPFFPETPLLKQTNDFTTKLSEKISQTINRPFK